MCIRDSIITDHYEWFTDEYTDQEDFRRWRNSVGALLLLHKSINASLNDSRYGYKPVSYTHLDVYKRQTEHRVNYGFAVLSCHSGSGILDVDDPVSLG